MISLYINGQVRAKVSTKVNPSYEDALQLEIDQMKKANLNIHLEGFKKPWLKIGTSFGPLDLWKHGNNTENIVIFVHGIQCNNRTVVKVLDYYFSRNFTVIAYDNFGWGKSRKMGRCTFGLKESELLREVIDIVKKEYPSSNIHLHGESMGGGTIYKFIDTYGQYGIKSFFVDGGYFSFFGNVMEMANKTLPYVANIARPLLSLQFALETFPVKKMVRPEKLNDTKNITHVHSENDLLVGYKSLGSYKELVNFYTYKNPDTRHVRGYYDAKEELYKVLDDHYKKAA